MTWLLAKSFFGLPRLFWAGLGALAVLAALVWGAHALYDDIKQSGRDEVQAQWEAEKVGRALASAELSSALTQAFSGLDSSLQGAIKTISYKGRDITIRVKKELDNDPRYTSAACELTPGVLEQLNAARSVSHASTPTGVSDGGVPTSGAAVRLDIRRADSR